MKLAIPEGPFAAYIFDCDGTLADTMPLHYRAWRRLLQEYGAPFSEELFYQLGGKPTTQILEVMRDEHGVQVPDLQQAAERKEHYFLEMIHEVKPIEAVLEIAVQAHTVIPMAVASGGFRRNVEITLDAIGIRGLFEAIVCVEDYARGKPFPDPFLEAARRLKTPADQCLVFEDSPLGIQAADAAHMRSVFVPRGDVSMIAAPP